MPDMLALKKDYLLGIKPKELSEKYNMPETQIYTYIKTHNLNSKKQLLNLKIEEKVEKLIEDRISKLTNKSLDVLENSLESENESNRLKAVAEILDLSGYKKQTVNNNNKTEFINHIMLDD